MIRRLLAALGVLLLLPISAATTNAAAATRHVSVDQTTNLVNQVVRVSWTGFKPSSDTTLTDSTRYIVRVYQCRGTEPADLTACYGSSTFDYDGKVAGGSVIPDGPANAVTTITQKNGTGTADIEVRTIQESASLGCTAASACSLVVVPNDGDPASPDLDVVDAIQANADAAWAWANRIVVPLSFTPTGSACALKKADATGSGSPAIQRLVQQWQPKLCNMAGPTDVDYTTLGEPQARAAFDAKTIDVAFTTRADPATATRPYAYAPVANTGIAIAYRIDDYDTGRPITDLKLTPRLVAKLITESYGMSGQCSEGVTDCDKAVNGNPKAIFQDPEFLKLNGGHSWPIISGWPTVVSGTNDLTYELTRWLAADPDTAAFLKGKKGPGGHVNTHFKNVTYPTDEFQARDSDKRFTHGYIPVLGLNNVAKYLVTNRDNSENYVKDATGNYAKTAPYPVGTRGLIAIVSTADSAALRFPTARIRNAAGTYVAPTTAAMRAALADMKAGATQQADFTSKDKAAYPLTMVHYAMVPTNGAGKTKAERIARFLDHAAGNGQVPGITIGNLPVGYVPLTTAQRAATRAAATAVRAQKGVLPAAAATPSSTPAAGTPAAVAPQAPAVANPTVQLPVVAGLAAMGGRLSGTSSGLAKWILPALLVAGVAAGLLGPLLYGAGSGLDPRRITAYLGRRRR